VVAARDHPLASVKGSIAKSELTKHVQLVLTDRTSLSEGREFGVMSPQTWRLADLFAKHAFLLNGLGWGGMPLHTVERDISEGRAGGALDRGRNAGKSDHADVGRLSDLGAAGPRRSLADRTVQALLQPDTGQFAILNRRRH